MLQVGERLLSGWVVKWNIAAAAYSVEDEVEALLAINDGLK